MNSLAFLWSRLRWVGLAGGSLLAGAAGANLPPLAVHLRFELGAEGELVARNAVTNQTMAVREGKWANGAAEFDGKPAQGIGLGVLSFEQPLTIVFWLRRSAQPVAHPEGRDLPEYRQEHGLSQGRLLGAARGNPAEMSGSLRIGPEKLEVWHARNRWSTVIPGPIPFGQWVHVAVAYGEDLKVTGYLNGEKKGTTQAAYNFRGNPVSIAAPALERRFGYPFAGRIREVRIYRGVLAADDIAALYSQAPPE